MERSLDPARSAEGGPIESRVRNVAKVYPIPAPHAVDASVALASRPSYFDCLRPSAWELVGLALLLASYLISEQVLGRDIYAATNIVGPLGLMGLLSFGLARMARMNPNAIWTALFWFRLATAVYFGLGCLVPVFANGETRAYMEAFFIFDSEDLAKVNVLTVASTFITLATAYVLAPSLVAGSRVGAMASERGNGARQGNLLLIGIAFLAFGAIIKYFVILPHQFNLTQDTLDGSVGTLAGLVLVGIFFLSAWAFEYSQRWVPLIMAPLLIDIAVGILTFAKSEVMFALIMFFLGMLRRSVTKPRLVIAVTTIVLTYVLVTPITSYGRAELARTRGAISASASLGERASIIASYFEGGASVAESEQIDWAWVRISYVNAAAYAVHLRDTGMTSQSLATLPAVIIPRFLWPNKPIITQIGVDFNSAATGNDQSASSPGLFAEAYWNFGWLGVGILMIPLGAILSAMSAFALRVLRDESWLFFPIVLLGMKMGLRVDGYFVADIAGAGVIALAVYAVLALLIRLANSLFRPSRSA
jgi:hypothetical protein